MSSEKQFSENGHVPNIAIILCFMFMSFKMISPDVQAISDQRNLLELKCVLYFSFANPSKSGPPCDPSLEFGVSGGF